MQHISIKKVLQFVIHEGFWIIAFGLFLSAFAKFTSSFSPAPTPTTIPQSSQETMRAPDVTAGSSLPTGTVLKKQDVYMQGNGQLQINNDTNNDAVAKLILGDTSVFTVYIKSNSTYTIQHITDGIYRFAFVRGTDWNASTQQFNQNAYASVLDDTFEFKTTAGQSAGWKVTLHELSSDTANTNDVDPSQLYRY
jgi:hypothetical protein